MEFNKVSDFFHTKKSGNKILKMHPFPLGTKVRRCNDQGTGILNTPALSEMKMYGDIKTLGYNIRDRIIRG